MIVTSKSVRQFDTHILEQLPSIRDFCVGNLNNYRGHLMSEFKSSGDLIDYWVSS